MVRNLSTYVHVHFLLFILRTVISHYASVRFSIHQPKPTHKGTSTDDPANGFKAITPLTYQISRPQPINMGLLRQVNDCFTPQPSSSPQQQPAPQPQTTLPHPSSTDGSRTLNVHADDHLYRHITLFSTSQQPMCTIKCHMRKPHLEFFRPDSSARFATATFHVLSTSVDLEINKREMQLKTKGFLKDSYTFEATSGRQLTWQSKSKMSLTDLVCVDAEGSQVATYVGKIGWKDIGSLEIITGVTGEAGEKATASLDELLVTGMVVAYQKLTAAAAVGSSAASASSAAAVSAAVAAT